MIFKRKELGYRYSLNKVKLSSVSNVMVILGGIRSGEYCCDLDLKNVS